MFCVLWCCFFVYHLMLVSTSARVYLYLCIVLLFVVNHIIFFIIIFIFIYCGLIRDWTSLSYSLLLLSSFLSILSHQILNSVEEQPIYIVGGGGGFWLNIIVQSMHFLLQQHYEEYTCNQFHLLSKSENPSTLYISTLK